MKALIDINLQIRQTAMSNYDKKSRGIERLVFTSWGACAKLAIAVPVILRFGQLTQ